MATREELDEHSVFVFDHEERPRLGLIHQHHTPGMVRRFDDNDNIARVAQASGAP